MECPIGYGMMRDHGDDADDDDELGIVNELDVEIEQCSW